MTGPYISALSRCFSIGVCMCACVYVCVHVCVCICVGLAGQWMEEEEDRLSQSVLSAFKESANTQLADEDQEDRLPCDTPLPATKTWDLVSSEVGTRSAQQCRHKW